VPGWRGCPARLPLLGEPLRGRAGHPLGMLRQGHGPARAPFPLGDTGIREKTEAPHAAQPCFGSGPASVPHFEQTRRTYAAGRRCQRERRDCRTCSTLAGSSRFESAATTPSCESARCASSATASCARAGSPAAVDQPSGSLVRLPPSIAGNARAAKGSPRSTDARTVAADGSIAGAGIEPAISGL
jgi:hypothetical protein